MRSFMLIITVVLAALVRCTNPADENYIEPYDNDFGNNIEIADGAAGDDSGIAKDSGDSDTDSGDSEDVVDAGHRQPVSEGRPIHRKPTRDDDAGIDDRK